MSAEPQGAAVITVNTLGGASFVVGAKSPDLPR